MKLTNRRLGTVQIPSDEFLLRAINELKSIGAGTKIEMTIADLNHFLNPGNKSMARALADAVARAVERDDKFDENLYLTEKGLATEAAGKFGISEAGKQFLNEVHEKIKKEIYNLGKG